MILSSKQIDIWQFSLTPWHPQAEKLLTLDELARANRYYFTKHRQRFIMARAGLRLLLSKYLALPPQEIVFTYNPYGKPAVANVYNLTFNLSHSHELALLGVGCTHALGIDLEFFSFRPYAGIAANLFSTQENLALLQAPAAIQTLIFFHIWAQKEAFIKACGLGLSYPTQSFDVTASCPNHDLVWDSMHAMQWKMHTFMPKIACAAALCHHPEVQKIDYRLFEFKNHESPQGFV